MFQRESFTLNILQKQIKCIHHFWKKAEEASKQIFQAVGICPVPIFSDELVKQKENKTKPQNNNHN